MVKETGPAVSLTVLQAYVTMKLHLLKTASEVKTTKVRGNIVLKNGLYASPSSISVTKSTNEMGGACSRHGGHQKRIRNFGRKA
jgi:hypothetical protein